MSIELQFAGRCRAGGPGMGIVAALFAVHASGALPGEQSTATYLANTYIDFTWDTKTGTDGYTDLPYFDLAVRAGDQTGLGVQTVTGLPEITFDPLILRTNGQVTATTIRHYTAASVDGSDVPFDLWLAGAGSIGYRFLGPDATPYQLDPILDAGIDLTVKVHSASGAVTTIWSGGSNVLKDRADDLFAYGGFTDQHWAVNHTPDGVRADLLFNELYHDLLAIPDGETFAVEFQLKGSSRNYDHPNWESYVEMYHSISADPVPGSAGSTFSAVTPVSSAGAHPSWATSAVGVTGHAEILTTGRPPDIIPSVGNVFSDTVTHADGFVHRYARDTASVNPFGPGGSLGAEARINVSHATNSVDAPPTLQSVFASPSYNSAYTLAWEGDGEAPDLVDVDLDLVLDGSFELIAREPGVLPLTEMVGPFGPTDATLRVRAYVKSGSQSEEVLDLYMAFNGTTPWYEDGTEELLANHFVLTPITNNDGQLLGGTLTIDLDTRLLDEDDPLVQQLQDVLMVAPGEFVEVMFNLEVAATIHGEQVALVESVAADFYNTLAPGLTTDTEGVTFVNLSVPEPASFALLGTGALTLVGGRRSWRQAQRSMG